MRQIRNFFIALILGFGLMVSLLWILGEQHTPVVRAATITVTITDDIIASDGECSLREAISAANNNAAFSDCPAGSAAIPDVIDLPDGVFTIALAGVSEDSNATGDFDINDSAGLRIIGDDTTETIIDGGGVDRILHVLAGSLELNSLTLQNGRAPATTPEGAAINYVTPGGTLDIIDTHIFSNSAATNGGGIVLQGSGVVLNISNTIFQNNLADDAGAFDGDGGAIENTGADNKITILDSTFIANQSQEKGGAIHHQADNAVMVVKRSTFLSNSVRAAGSGSGGAIASGAEVHIEQSALLDNEAQNIGGGIYHFSRTLSITNSTFSGNQAVTRGGAIELFTFGSSASPADVFLNNVSIINNSALSEGGGISNNTPPGIYEIANSIIAQNSAPTGPDCFSAVSPITSRGYNLIGQAESSCWISNTGDITGSTASPLAPEVDDLQGTPAVHPLKFDSPAVDAGNPLTPDGDFNKCAMTDQLGTVRPQADYCDIGAYERNGDINRLVDTEQMLGSGNSQAVALADLDGDGDIDAFVVNASPNIIWINDGSGSFFDAFPGLGSSTSTAVALGDLDNNNTPDAFVANADGEANQVWLNDGTGAFTATFPGLGSGDSQSVALGDLNGDTHLDAFVGNSSGQSNQVWLNDGTGLLSDSLDGLGNEDTMAVALGDLDGDGDLDAFIGNGSGQTNQVWFNNGAGTFTDSGQTLSLSDTTSIALGDIDSDNDLDIFVGNFNNQADQVLLNNGGAQNGITGTFTIWQHLGNSDSQAVALGDFDGDNDLDVVVATPGPNLIWENDGAGNFIESGTTLGNFNSNGVAVEDLNGDGLLDVFVANGDGEADHVYGYTIMKIYLPTILKVPVN